MHNHEDQYETYEEGNAWITPVGSCRIVHHDCPTKEEIKQRVTEVLNEIIHDTAFEDDCPLCKMMKDQPYEVVYTCETSCDVCKKAKICRNFDPNSKSDEFDDV